MLRLGDLEQVARHARPARRRAIAPARAEQSAYRIRIEATKRGANRTVDLHRDVADALAGRSTTPSMRPAPPSGSPATTTTTLRLLALATGEHLPAPDQRAVGRGAAGHPRPRRARSQR